MDILNQFEITEKIASSGQPDEAQLEWIASRGYEAVINLAMPDHKKSIANEGSIVTSLGMTYIHIPVPFEAPTDDHMTAFSAYMDALESNKVWVHCIVNARVSAFLFRYLQKNRAWSAPAAATPLLEQWLPEMNTVWKDFISHAPDQL
jgi:protein tyrosine phosphatase (PTP) superfamily phosphohydrolase (DUF442 family)